MRDWLGTRVHADALTVPCLYCGASEGEPCVAKADGKPITAFPAHTSRIKESQRSSAQSPETGGAA